MPINSHPYLVIAYIIGQFFTKECFAMTSHQFGARWGLQTSPDPS